MKKAIQIKYNDMFEMKCECASLSGFEYISVNLDGVGERINPSPEKAAEDILRIMNKYNIKPAQSHLPYYDLRISAEILDDEMEKTMRNAIKISGMVGAEWCVYHPRTAINDGYVSAKSLEINKRVISEYIDCATKSDTKIALENLPIFDMKPMMPFYTSDYSDLCDLTDSFNTDAVGICWDTGHANMMHFNQAKAVEYVGKRIKCTHIHNNWQVRDDHNSPNNGTIKWDEVMGAFKKINYEGPLTLESHCWCDEYEILKSFAKHNYVCLEYLERLMK